VKTEDAPKLSTKIRLCRVCSLALPLTDDGVQNLWTHECYTTELREVPDEEILEADRQSILDELARWQCANKKVTSLRNCEYCTEHYANAPEWRRHGRITLRVWGDGRPAEFYCSFCGRSAE
jgi:predicted nucleic acid binding AN1-type Zn finger protein